jgi:hypothetical protein
VMHQKQKENLRKLFKVSVHFFVCILRVIQNVCKLGTAGRVHFQVK